MFQPLLNAVALFLSLTSVVTSQPGGFVRVDPNDRRYFQLNGKRFQFQGANQRELAINLTPDQIAKQMKDNSDMGLKVVRLWAFNEESCGVTGCFVTINQNKQPVIMDNALRRLDYVLYYARQYNIKVILAPVNYERSFGGMEWWVHTLKGTNVPAIAFYTDPQVQAAYKFYLKALVQRTNHLNGIRYSDDSTIMAWDTANEPHTKDGSDWSGQIVANWVCSIAGYMKWELKVKQMVTSGEEGYQTNGYLGGANVRHEWVQNGLKGVDFATNAKCQNLDFMTVHLYPDNWEIPPEEFPGYVNAFLYERAEITRKYGKPLVVEEFGCCLDARYKGRRFEMFHHYLWSFNANKVAGQLVWQLFPNNSPLLKDVLNYDFTPATDYQSANFLLQLANRFNQ